MSVSPNTRQHCWHLTLPGVKCCHCGKSRSVVHPGKIPEGHGLHCPDEYRELTWSDPGPCVSVEQKEAE